MNPKELLSDLTRFLAGHGGAGHPRPELIAKWLDTQPPEAAEHLPWLLRAADAAPADHYLIPEPITGFVARLAELTAPKTILDPCCGTGLLLKNVADRLQSEAISAYGRDLSMLPLADTLLGGTGRARPSRGWIPDIKDPGTYDLILSALPAGIRTAFDPAPEPLVAKRKYDVAHALMIWSASRLSDRGIGMFFVPAASLRGNRLERLCKDLGDLGCRLRALFRIPVPILHGSYIETYLAVIDRGKQSAILVGQLAEAPEHQDVLLESYRRHRAGLRLALGRLVPIAEFRGFGALEASERVKELVKGLNWRAVEGSQLITAAEVAIPGRPFEMEHGSDSVYLSTVGELHATTSEESIPLTPRGEKPRIVHLRLNRNVVEPEYFARWTTESPIGRSNMDWVGGLSTLRRITPKDLQTGRYYLPPLPEQRALLANAARLRKLDGEMQELKDLLWSHREGMDGIADRIANLNREDGYGDWIESLPFPLASILWRHHAEGGSRRGAFPILLHFFEALAAFLATVHLSANQTDDEAWPDLWRNLRAILDEQKLTLERPTFGTWKLVVEFLTARGRRAMVKDQEENTANVARRLCTSNHLILKMLHSPELASILQRANNIRNATVGHGGTIGEDRAAELDVELQGLVYELRGVFGRNWLQFPLIKPGAGAFRNGLHCYVAPRIMGTRSAPFPQISAESSHPLEEDTLYLFDVENRTGLQLFPFIKVIPSPARQATACYVFNKRERDMALFVSYHFEAESACEQPLTELDRALEQLGRFEA